MKQIILATLCAVTIALPACADPSPICIDQNCKAMKPKKKLLSGINARKILGAPFWVAGFTVTLVGDITVRPFVDGALHYVYEPAIKGW